MKDRPIHYEPHPVSRERKAELAAQGYQIIDARFAPAEAADEPDADTAPAPHSRRKNRKG